MDTQLARLPRSVRILHWLAVLGVALAYLTSESAEEGAGALWHTFAGWVLLVIFLPRLVLHWKHRQAFFSHGSGLQATLATTVHWALLLFLVVQPLLGILTVWAEGDAVLLPFTPWALASPFAGQLGEWPEELHEGLGTAFYFVIALHAGASLWHHFVSRDPVLRRMV